MKLPLPGDRKLNPDIKKDIKDVLEELITEINTDNSGFNTDFSIKKSVFMYALNSFFGSVLEKNTGLKMKKK